MYPYPPPENSSEDYLTQFQRLLPRGRIWHRGWGWIQDEDLLTLMPAWSRLQTALNTLIGEILPCSTMQLLPEWEATLGLPDPCTGPLPTLQQRQAAVCAKFIMRGGQSAQYFKDLAEAHGFTIDIKTFYAFRVDFNTVEQPLYDSAWDFAWTVVSVEDTYIYFRPDQSRADDPLVAWGNEQLECLIQEYAPAHTIVMFEYHYSQSVWDAGASVWDAGASTWDQWAP